MENEKSTTSIDKTTESIGQHITSLMQSSVIAGLDGCADQDWELIHKNNLIYASNIMSLLVSNMRSRGEIQRAHDVLIPFINGEIPSHADPGEKDRLHAVVDCLCWILKHDHTIEPVESTSAEIAQLPITPSSRFRSAIAPTCELVSGAILSGIADQ